jgi:hypothetical protein
MSLTQRVSDLILAFKLLLWGWAILSPAAIAGVAWLMSPAGLGWAWRDYILARLADFAGLGQVPVIPIAGAWVRPAGVLAWSSEKFPSATLARWDSDFLVLALIPLVTALVLSMLGSVIHLYRKKGTSR